MGFGATVKHNFSHYADFGGRAQRSQFWWWYLFLIIMQVLLNAADSAFGLQVGRSETDVTVGDTTIPVVNNGVGRAVDGVRAGDPAADPGGGGSTTP